MIFLNKIPFPPLDNHVQHIVYYRDYVPEHDKDKFVPDGTTNLIIDFGDIPKYIYDNDTLAEKQECTRAWFSGMHTEYLTISSGIHSEMLVITFKPGGSSPFINLPLEGFSNKVVAADLVFGTSVFQFREDLKKGAAPDDIVALAEHWLNAHLGETSFTGKLVQHFVARIQEAPTGVNLKAMAQESGYSHKQFIHLFKKHVGLAPKQLHRILRFNEILQAIHNMEIVDWPAVFIDCGYYDQAHFIKDFQSFSGINPQKYLEQQGEWPHYIPVR